MPPGLQTFITKKRWMTVEAFCFWLLNQSRIRPSFLFWSHILMVIAAILT
jgi:hypothetical protein